MPRHRFAFVLPLVLCISTAAFGDTLNLGSVSYDVLIPEAVVHRASMSLTSQTSLAIRYRAGSRCHPISLSLTRSHSSAVA